jgi:hypothetical protein
LDARTEHPPRSLSVVARGYRIPEAAATSAIAQV